MAVLLDFEKPLEELLEQLEKAQATHDKGNVDMSDTVAQLTKKINNEKKDLYKNLSGWQKVQISRHPDRPYTLDYIAAIAKNFIELHGDRNVGDDKAMVGGLAQIDNQNVMIIGQQKGRTTKERQYRNFGMPNPEGYRKALRLMRMAEKFNMPVICLIDTPGAFPGLEAEERLIGRGLSTCATCDGFFFRGKEIAVVGGGDSAIEEASFLTKFASKVTLIHRRDSFRASKIMQDRALSNPKIEMLWNTAVTEIVGKDQLESISLKNTVTGEESSMAVAGLFIAIGHRPNTDVFKGVIDMEDSGYLITRPDSTYTNIEGVFACGDVKDHVYRQAITAAGSGCMAAIDTERWLEQQH